MLTSKQIDARIDAKMKSLGGMVYYDPTARKIFKSSRPGVFEGGVITTTDISAIEAQVVLEEVMGGARELYSLRPLCRPITMNKLVTSIDIKVKLAGQRKVPELVEADISKQSYSRTNFDLWKNVVHVVMSDEAGMKAAHDIMALHIDDASGDLARMENLDVKDIAEACTEKVAASVYSDWSAVTTGVSDTNPLLAITASLNYIAGQGYPPSHVAMHPTIWSYFITNTWIRDLVQSGIIDENLKRVSLPGYPTIQVITDWALTETPTASIGPLVLSQRAPAIVLGQGPVTAAKYRSEAAGYDAYIIRQYLEPKIVIDAAMDMICT